MTKELKKNIELLNEHLEMLRDEYYIGHIGIFGSVAKGTHTKKSDLDVLVDFFQPIGLFEFVELENKLSKILKRKVDLVSRDALKPLLKKSILNEVIYAKAE